MILGPQGKIETRIVGFDKENVAEDAKESNLIIGVDMSGFVPNIKLTINDNKLFRTLENRAEIAGAINKKLNELVQEHLSKVADDQENLARER